MKKSIVAFVCGLALSVVVLESATRIMSPLLGPPLVSWNTMEDAKRLKLSEFHAKYKDPEYVFMGNSTVLIGLDPNIFDLEANLPKGSSFNAAMNGSQIRQIRDFACNYILTNIQPKNLVILFSNPTMAIDPDYREPVTNASTVERNLYLYRYRNTFRDPMTLNTLIRVLRFQNTRQGIVYRWADNLDDFGYTKYETTQAKIATAGWTPNVMPKSIDGGQQPIDLLGLRYLIEIRDLARAQGGDLIIGTVPTLSLDPVYRGAIKQISKTLGLKFVEGNDALGEGKFFQDRVHLNKQGAAKFSKFLAGELSKMNE